MAKWCQWAHGEIKRLTPMDVSGVQMGRTTRGTYQIDPPSKDSATVGRLDQAIYAKGNADRRQIYGVSGGVAFMLGQNGAIQKSKRFAAGWGDASICYDPVNDKVIVSFWNEERGDDNGFSEGEISTGTDGEVSASVLTSASASWSDSYVGATIFISNGTAGYTRQISDVSDANTLSFYGDSVPNGTGYYWVFAATQKGLYKLNADSLEVELFSPLFTPSTMNTAAIDGPHQILYYGGSVYSTFFGRVSFGSDKFSQMIKIDPVTLQPTATGSQFSDESSPFSDLAIDSDNALLWATDSAGLALDSMDLATFSSLGGFDMSPKITEPGDGTVGNLTPLPMDGQTHNFGTGFGDGYYIIKYTGGCTRNLADGKYFVFLFDPDTGLAFRYITGLPLGDGQFHDSEEEAKNGFADAGNFEIATSFSGSGTIGLTPTGWAGDTYDNGTPYTQGMLLLASDNFVWGSNGFLDNLGGDTNLGIDPAASYPTWDSSTTYSAGDRVFLMPFSGFQGAIYEARATNTNHDPRSDGSTDMSGHDKWFARWVQTLQIVEDYAFDLVQVTKYLGDSPQFPPYGLCVATGIKTIYVTSRSFRLGFYNIAADRSGVINLTIPDPDHPDDVAARLVDYSAFPYRARCNPYDRKVYVPGYRSNTVYIVDPGQNRVVDSRSGFDSPFDVIFTPPPPGAPDDDKGGVLVVQHGDVGLKRLT